MLRLLLDSWRPSTNDVSTPPIEQPRREQRSRVLHPDVANLYDSLGEFLLEKGDREAAIRSYEKALEVDPEFENAQRVLAELATQN